MAMERVFQIKEERNIQAESLMAMSKAGSTMFRVNTGTGWVGKIIKRTPQFITIENPRPLRAGLCVGGSDTIGWTPVVVTQEMVGQTVAIFTAAEIKKQNGKVTNEQQNFINRVNSCGGRAGVARTSAEAVKIASGD